MTDEEQDVPKFTALFAVSFVRYCNPDRDLSSFPKFVSGYLL